MKINVVMDSGKEYTIETDETIGSFIDKTATPKGFQTNYMTLAENIIINCLHISSIEILD